MRVCRACQGDTDSIVQVWGRQRDWEGGDKRSGVDVGVVQVVEQGLGELMQAE